MSVMDSVRDKAGVRCIDLSGTNISNLAHTDLNSAAYVRLSFNPLKDLSTSFGYGLIYLDISHTYVRNIPYQFCLLGNLERIDADEVILNFPDCFCGPSIKVINAELIDIQSNQNWTDCVSLRNANFYLPDDSIEAHKALTDIAHMESLTHLGLYNFRWSIPLEFNQGGNITSLSISLANISYLEQLVLQISSWKDLERLEVILPHPAPIPPKISLLTNLKTLIIRTLDFGLVTMPSEIEQLHLEEIFVFKNLRNFHRFEKTAILFGTANDMSYYRRHNFNLEWYSGSITMIK